jgi:flagellar L-ring protein precursor FlgH
MFGTRLGEPKSSFLLLFGALASGLAPAAWADPPKEFPDYSASMPAIPPVAAPGSLWSEAQARAMIGMDGNARRVGDLITVRITEDTRAEALADTETRRSSTVEGGITKFFGVAEGATKANPNMGGEIGLAATGGSEYRGDGKTRREGALTGMLTCWVVEKYPNGNLRIYGWKEVRTNRETQYLVLTGIIRPRDIQANNVIASDFVAEARIQFDGSGVVADKQGPGFGTRVVDHAWPF